MVNPSGSGRAPTRALGRPKADAGRDTRADLIRVARELFATRGYAGTSVADIGERAGVTVPVIYQRFGNKAGLFVAVAEDVYDRSLDRLRDRLAAAVTFDDALTGALHEFATIYEVDPLIGAMVVTVLVEVERSAELGRALKPTLRRLRAYCDDIADLAPATLAPDAAARRDLSRGLVAVFSGIMMSSLLLRRAPDYERMVAAVAQLVRR